MAHEAMEYFEDLGRRIEERWRSAGFDDRAISSIAEEELVRTPAHLHVTPDDVLEWCNRPGFDLPAQSDLEARFGDPPVTVFRARQMVIDVNFWIDSPIAIHEHSFDGAFQVLSGSSMHTQYDFVEKARYNSYTYAGDLTAHDTEQLSPGDVRQIRAGSEFIHALFHLERPSSTVVVRTLENPLVGIQRDFVAPGFAFSSFHIDPTAQRNTQVARLMITCESPRFEAWLTRYLEAADPGATFHMLLTVWTAWRERPDVTASELDARIDPFISLVEKSSSWGTLVASAFRDRLRSMQLMSARYAVEDPEQRWFLALLLNAPSSTRILSAVERRFPTESPLDKVFGWVEELCVQRTVLGIMLSRATLRIARCLAQGKTHEAIARELSEGRTQPLSARDIESAARELRRSPLRPLFLFPARTSRPRAGSGLAT